MEVEVERSAARAAGAGRFIEPGGHEAFDDAFIERGAILGQVRSFGNDIETGEQGDAFVGDQVHDVALAFFADEFEGQQGAHGLFGRDHGRTGEFGLADDLVQAQVAHQGHEDEQAAETRAEGAWLEVESADVGDGGDVGTDRLWSFVVASPRQAGEPFLMQQDRQRMDADGLAFGGELALDVVDGQVLLAQGDGAFADEIARRRLPRPRARRGEEGFAFVGIATKLVTEDAKGAGGIGEAAGDLSGRKLVDEISAEGFVLSLGGRLGSREELSGLPVR